ncbi:hypothetical protein MMC18_004333 [Xylographa bjoerkii]|nr:hypothetical protein [Xylographa bjoerkii]
MSLHLTNSSPTPRGKLSAQFVIHDDNESADQSSPSPRGPGSVLLEHQKNALNSSENNTPCLEIDDSMSSSVPLTPATDSFSVTAGTDDSDGQKTIQLDAAEMLRLKKELDAAKNKIARQEQELSQTRRIKHTFEQARDPISGPAAVNKSDPVVRTIANIQEAFSATNRPFGQRQEIIGNHEDARSDISDALSAGAYNRAQNIWSGNATQSYNHGLPSPGNQQLQAQTNIWGQGGRQWGNRPMAPALPPLMVPQQQQVQRNYSGPTSPMSGVSHYGSDFGQYHGGQGLRRSNTQNSRSGSAFAHGRNMGWDTYGNSSDGGLMNMGPPSSFQPMGMFQAPMSYQPRPIGTPLSPTAAEFTASSISTNPWNTTTPSSPGQTYVSPLEPLNYRRLLDRSVTCNWKYIVDKIVCNNDQQASIFLQQKLKVGTAEQKFEIVEAIVAQAYPLMVNRFGNFLVQRCFEHGTPDQVISIANAIRGNTLSLSMDAFGCHVVQKAFDAVPEDYKAIMVHELLRRIPETVIHRYACHVWQKLFELRWSDSPPQIMKYVNEALQGMWHEVALGETGSLVVQNIFENCLEEDKRPCISEVLASIDIVAHGQFGNWCIQHICEHGAPADRSRAIDHVLRYATEYSMDQFASKVVEKCLKIGGAEFLERYLERVCDGRADRPRIPLIDISSDQYGNYLIQYILTHANAQHREIVASHIRKHMVSLRGSKFGSRVGMLCSNPAYATRPGPAVGPPPVNRFNNTNNVSANRFGPAYR